MTPRRPLEVASVAAGSAAVLAATDHSRLAAAVGVVALAAITVVILIVTDRETR